MMQVAHPVNDIMHVLHHLNWVCRARWVIQLYRNSIFNQSIYSFTVQT